MIFGVDLRASPKRKSSVVALDDRAQFSFLNNFRNDDELLQMSEEFQPSLIAIGAPLTLPASLCCLEASCPCSATPPQKKGRAAELELSRMGISCFFTNKRSIIRTLIYRGINISRQLTNQGRQVIEVYPHGTKVILFGDKIPPKNSKESLDFMKDRLTPLVEGLDVCLDNLDRNSCDAVVNAYTGLLHSQDDTDMLGTDDDGWLVLPRLHR